VSSIKMLSVFVIIITLVGCATTPKVLNPPRVPAVAKLKRVAFSSFEGRDASLFKTELENELVSLFDVVSPRNAQGIFTGQVIDSSVTKNSYTEKRGGGEKCVKRRYGLVGPCEKRENVPASKTRCTKREAKFEAIVSVQKVGKEKVYSRKVHGTETDTHCEDSSSSPETDSSLLSKARKKALVEIRRDVGAYYTGGGVSLNPMDTVNMWRNKWRGKDN
jgi:hypothetical protein